MKQYPLFFLTFIAAVLILFGGRVFGQDSSPIERAPAAESIQIEPLAVEALLGTAFTYQGQLKQSGTAVNGACDFQFRLYDALNGGAQIGSAQTKTNVAVSAGLFTVANLDFGSGAFNGEARWLATSVRCPAGDGSYTALTPRQALTPAPYALALPGFYTTQNATSPNLIGGHVGNSVTDGVVGATISGGGVSGNGNRVTDDYGTIGGGADNQAGDNAGTTSDRPFATVGGGYSNTASGIWATVGGGVNNIASGDSATVGGGLNNTTNGNRATVGGGDSNTASDGWATVGGGYSNTASGEWATVGGGDRNTASGQVSLVSGGFQNTASGTRATVGGGDTNTASGGDATVGGGYGNIASGARATVGGGYGNIASGIYGTVPGGLFNAAVGSYSFAAGHRAKANHNGAFVWGGSINADVASPADNTFSVRAPGGVWLGTTNTPAIPAGRFLNTSTGGYLTTGGVWTNSSDRNVKENFTPVDPQLILTQVAALPLTTWNYRSETAVTRHLGAMAQDFHAAFGLGADDTSIGTIDADGVALAAIQGLYQLAQAQEAEITAQQTEITMLAERLAALEKQVNGGGAASSSALPGWLAFALSLGGLAMGLVWYGRPAGSQ